MHAFRTFSLGLVLGASALPLAAQGLGGSRSETFLKAVRDEDANTAIPIADAMGAPVINYRGYDGATPLTIAVKRKSLSWIAFLLGRSADANLADGQGQTPLGLAASTGNVEAIDLLVSARAGIDGANRMGETPLIIAVVQHQPAAMRRLLEYGANPDKADHSAGLSAREYARRDTRNPQMLQLINSVKAKVSAKQGPHL